MTFTFYLENCPDLKFKCEAMYFKYIQAMCAEGYIPEPNFCENKCGSIIITNLGQCFLMSLAVVTLRYQTGFDCEKR